MPEKLWTLGYLNQNLIIYESNKVFLLLKNILAFIFEIFTAFFLLLQEKKGILIFAITNRRRRVVGDVSPAPVDPDRVFREILR